MDVTPVYHPPAMSSTPTSSSSFQPIFDAALSDFSKKTGIDLATHPFAQIIQNCQSADAILDLLQDRSRQFSTYRDGNRKFIDCLKPVVQTLHSFSGLLAGVAALVSPPCFQDFQSNLSHPFCQPSPLQSPFSPANTILVAVDVLLAVCISPTFIRPHPYSSLCYVSGFQTAIGVSASYDALLDLFECVGKFLNRLRVYAEIPFSPPMSDIIVNIMVEVLSVLSLATNQTKQGRLSTSLTVT